MKLNFTSLAYFKKAAEMEHLTKAAEALHIAQPALSRTIRGLEEELNVTLFEKEGRSIRLTRDGHILLKYAERFLADYDGLQQELKDSRDLQQMTVTLSILSATKLIPAFLAEFKKANPSAMVEIVNPNMPMAHKMPDLTLYSSTNHIENSHTVTLFRESLVMVLPKTDRHANLPYVNLADFRDLAALPVGDQDCHRYLNLSWKTEGHLSLTAVLLREFIVDHFWEYVREKANSEFPMG